jgi:hypothetical protein
MGGIEQHGNTCFLSKDSVINLLRRSRRRSVGGSRGAGRRHRPLRPQCEGTAAKLGFKRRWPWRIRIVGWLESPPEASL